MSNDVYPDLPGLSFGVQRTPMFKTGLAETDSGREFSRAIWSAPKWRYRLKYEFLRSAASYAELQLLVGFFCRHQGRYDTWLFDDGDDNTATGVQFGTGNGTATVFQLTRSFGGYVEPVYELNGATTVYSNTGSGPAVVSGVTFGANGQVTFSTAPANGAVLTWSGKYYRRCRFRSDEMSPEKFLQDLWSLGQVEFTTVKP